MSESRIQPEDMKAVGLFMMLAMMEVALEIGGEEFMRQVETAAKTTINDPQNSFLPPSFIIEILEAKKPGSAERMASLMEALAEQSMEIDWRALQP